MTLSLCDNAFVRALISFGRMVFSPPDFQGRFPSGKRPYLSAMRLRESTLFPPPRITPSKWFSFSAETIYEVGADRGIFVTGRFAFGKNFPGRSGFVY